MQMPKTPSSAAEKPLALKTPAQSKSAIRVPSKKLVLSGAADRKLQVSKSLLAKMAATDEQGNERELIRIVLERHPHQDLGFDVDAPSGAPKGAKTGACVCSIRAGGLADGHFQLGDNIISVNGRNLTKKTADGVKTFLYRELFLRSVFIVERTVSDSKREAMDSVLQDVNDDQGMHITPEDLRLIEKFSRLHVADAEGNDARSVKDTDDLQTLEDDALDENEHKTLAKQEGGALELAKAEVPIEEHAKMHITADVGMIAALQDQPLAEKLPTPDGVDGSTAGYCLFAMGLTAVVGVTGYSIYQGLSSSDSASRLGVSHV